MFHTNCGVKDGLHWTGVLVRSLVNKALSLLQREKSRESFLWGPLIMTSLPFPSVFWVLNGYEVFFFLSCFAFLLFYF